MKFFTPKSKVAFLYDDSTLRQSMEKMKFHGFTAIPVIDRNGMYVGTLSEGRLLEYIAGNPNNHYTTVSHSYIRDILDPDYNPAVLINESFKTVLKRLAEQSFLAVTDDRGILVGIITKRDVIRYLADNLPDSFE
jgi:predicted transcriptional regulator